MIRHQDEEEKRVEEAYQKHKCKDCVWSKWQGKQIVSCLFPRCVKDNSHFMVDKLSMR
jgi:hypothetical protein